MSNEEGFFDGNRRWVYTQSVTGRFQRIHRWSGRVLLAFLVGMPWVYVGGHPAIQFDIPGRRVYALGTIFTTADGFLLALFGFLAAFSLFFFTSLFGRLWCGYACPQTVFLEEFARPIERFFEGDRSQRKALDAQPISPSVLARKAGKHLAFLAVSGLASASFVSWFAGAHDVWTLQAGSTAYAITGFFTLVWFADLAWFREQLCNYLCPYARFQGALCDDESLVVRYDEQLGEPRAAGKASLAENHCIDCKKCVSACPQGIDIREGFQLECIMCGRCIDACEGVMAKADKKPLIGYETLAASQGRATRIIRPRTVAYLTLMSAAATGIVAMLALHQPMEARLSRSPGPLWTVDADGWVRNTFLLDVTNNEAVDAPVAYQVTVTGLPLGAVFDVPEIILGTTEHRRVPLIVRIPPNTEVPHNVPLHVIVHSPDGDVVRQTNLKVPRS